MNSDAISLETRANIEGIPTPSTLGIPPLDSPAPASPAAAFPAEAAPTASLNNGGQCEEPDCEKKAKGSTGACIEHGGGKRCEEPGCEKSAQGVTNRCVGHGNVSQCVLLNIFNLPVVHSLRIARFSEIYFDLCSCVLGEIISRRRRTLRS